MKYAILYVLSLFFSMGCKAQKIVDKPIVFNQERKELTLNYLKDRYGLVQDDPTIDPKMIVIHWTAIPTFEASFRAFKNPRLPASRERISGASSLNVSSQFLIDRNGKIYRLMPETTMARHVIGLNHAAIGVENVGGTKATPLTAAQLKANSWLVKYLTKKYPIQYLIGHYQYTNFVGTPLWLEKDANYRTEKTDPGKDFMRKLRKTVKDLHFKPVPKKN